MVGSKVETFIEKQFRTKFDSKAREGVFLGFSDNSKTFIIGIDKGDGTLRTIKTRSAKFDEEKYFANQARNKSKVILKYIGMNLICHFLHLSLNSS